MELTIAELRKNQQSTIGNRQSRAIITAIAFPVETLKNQDDSSTFLLERLGVPKVRRPMRKRHSSEMQSVVDSGSWRDRTPKTGVVFD